MMPTCTVLPAGYDLDALSASGYYSVASAQNAPGSGHYMVEVVEANLNGNARQIQIAWSESGKQSLRIFNASGWSAWNGSSGGESSGGDSADLGVVDLSAIALLSTANAFGTLGVQPFMGDVQTFQAHPRGGATLTSTPGTAGTLLSTTGGTVVNLLSSGVTDTGGRIKSMFRQGLRTGATAGNNCILSFAYDYAHRGFGNANWGGFLMSTTFGFEAAAGGLGTAPAFFAGLWDGFSGSPVASGGDPSDEQNIFGIGFDVGETAFKLIHNDAADAATTVDLSSALGADQAAEGAIYKLMIAAAPGDTGISYRVERFDAVGSAVGRITTDIPANDVGLRAILAKTNGATAEEVGFSWMNFGMTYMLGTPAST